MLAAWMRMKYPNIVNGAVAASAPIYYFQNRKDLDINIFFKITTDDYRRYYFIFRNLFDSSSSLNDECPNIIKSAYERIWTADYSVYLLFLNLFF